MLENGQENTQAAVGADNAAPAPETAPSITDLDGLSEFSYQGEKLTHDQLHKVFSEHKTYGEQIKSYGQEKQFVDNLALDIENVLERPELASRFKTIYPQKYHAILDKYLNTRSTNTAQTQPEKPQMPKEFLNEFEQMKERFKFHEQRAYQAEVEAANAKLDAMLPKMFEKYPMAIEDQVYAKAEGILQSGQKLSEKTWERLTRESHESAQKRADQFYGAKLKTQLEKGQKASDVGQGGGTPGQAPNKPRTFAEAQEAMIASLQRQKNG